ncbi:hypothetical protein SAMN02745126_03463 [Enhydrobacter aerosaccus]|uniref:Uncharacterized protein n=1 Tax=Enhydrobacter aerosaccus TaxID=225324 RepID=A0A1T4R096_9HYPH|nr:hypothetical protein [Enhydrobacter aerosaccus]SKA09403.1 hypothetical protein SAMN02745126_03463 [Enhydrobacter aerosaccus]
MGLLAVFRSMLLDTVQRAAMVLVGYLMALGLMAAGVGFITLAAYRALLHGVGDVAAALIIGAGYVVASLIAMLALQLSRR